MSGGKVSSREAPTALNPAANMAAVFRDAGEISMERELDFVCERLRNNEALIYLSSGYLKDDSLVELLGGRMHATVELIMKVETVETKAHNQIATCCARLGRRGELSWGPLFFDQHLAGGVGLGGER